MRVRLKLAMTGSAAMLLGSAAMAEGIVVSIDISGAQTFATLGDASNETMVVDIAALAGLASGTAVEINGIGWDVVQTTSGTSWASEMVIAMDDGDADADLFVVTSGTGGVVTNEVNSSNGIMKLEDVPASNLVLDDGLLHLEFYETYDDLSNAADGLYEDGSMLHIQLVPSPAVLALLGLGGLAARRRRRCG